MAIWRRKAIRAAVTAFQAARRAVWYYTRPQSFGVHAVALTEAGEVILLRQTYTRGWRLPGGGRKPHEEPKAAMLRELREEIGLRRHASIEWVGQFHHTPDYRQGIAQVFLLRGVAFVPPSWSLEVEEVRAFPLADLPPNLPEVTTFQLRLAGLLPGEATLP